MLKDVEFVGRGATFKAPHFVQYVQQLLEERYGERVVQQGGLRVTTTLDLELQEKASLIGRRWLTVMSQPDVRANRGYNP